MTNLIFGMILGICLLLTVENTIKLHMKPKKANTEMTPEQKQREEERRIEDEQFEEMMKYTRDTGRNK